MSDQVQWQKFIIHHAASGGVHIETWDAIRRYHVLDNNWRDIGYHFGIGRDRNGKAVVFRGRPLSMMGSHCPNQNTVAIGICFLGNYMEKEPDQDMIDCCAALIVDLASDFNIDPTKVYPHKTFRATDCPGEKFDVNRVIEAVKTELEES